MATGWKDRVRQAVSAGGTGALTLGAAASGYQALGVSDDGLMFPYVIEDGAAWEIGYGTYTHAAASFARTSRDASSTGAALSVSTSATLFVDITAGFARGFDTAGRSIVPGCRLTLSAGVPVTTADVTGATAIYQTFFQHGALSLFDGNRRVVVDDIPEIAGAVGTKANATLYDVHNFLATLVPSATNTGTDILTFGAPHGLLTGAFARTSTTNGGLTAGVPYFVNVASSTTISLHTTLANALSGSSKVDLTANITDAIAFVSQEHVAWTNDSTRATDISLQDSRWSKVGDKTRLNIGLFRTTSTTTTEDSAGGTTSQVGGRRFLWNLYNQTRRGFGVTDGTTTWSYTADTTRQVNCPSGTNGNKVEVVLGLPAYVEVTAYGVAYLVSNGVNAAKTGVGVDTSTAFSDPVQGGFNSSVSGTYAPITGAMKRQVAAGYHQFIWCERGADGGCIFVGQPGDGQKTGMYGSVLA